MIDRTWWVSTKHAEGIYGEPPLRGCTCVICLHTREVRGYCHACNNGGGLEGCWVCGRGTYWTEPVTTDDPALAA